MAERKFNPVLAENRRARHDYTVLDTVECGIQLTGTEVKSARRGGVSLAGSYAAVLKGELWLVGADVSAPPVYKKPLSLYTEEGAYAFTHLGLVGVNRDLMNKDVPCAAFVGGNWEKDCGLYHYDGLTEISGTKFDTIEEIDRRNGGKEKTEARLEKVSDAIAATVTGEGLKEALGAAEKEISGADLDSELAYALIVFIGGAAAIAFFLFLILKRKKPVREGVWNERFEQTAKEADDPFSEFGGEEQKKEPENDDDVFRF